MGEVIKNSVVLDDYCKMVEFDPNASYKEPLTREEKLFLAFLMRYGWEKYKHEEYASGKHHIYMIFSYRHPARIQLVGFMHIMECNEKSKLAIQSCNLLYGKEELFRKKVVYIHTIDVIWKFRRRGYASWLVNYVKEHYGKNASIMVEAVKKGKKFWPAVGFEIVQKTLRGYFMMYRKTK